ncbi:MAG: ATP-binding protein [Gammaproteobacteria bacterium]|nr:ATP-binding protein [Gammaproteobacteria bacterium]
MAKLTGNPMQIPAGREGLADYIPTKDRNAPPYFAGRKRLLSDIEDACMAVWGRHEIKRTQIKGSTWMIYGAPGAGKSSILEYLQYAWQQGAYMTLDASGRERSGPTPALLNCDSGELHSLEDFCEKLADFVSKGQADKLFAQISKTMRVRGGGSVGFIEGSIEHERTKQYDAAKASLSAIVNVLSHSKLKRPLVIGIDEAQNLPRDPLSPEGLFLRAMHANQVNLPVIVLLAGLSDTKMRIRELGLSRLSRDNVYSLNGLDTAEVAELKVGFCAHFEIDLDRHSDEFDALLQRTDGWAAHLQNCLQAFSEVYLEAQCKIEAVDFARVEQLSLASRMSYYHARRSNAMKDSEGLLGMLMEQLTGSEERGNVLDMIQRIADDNAGSRSRIKKLPPGMSADDYYNDLIQSGALQERDDDKVICPIPSFRQFLIESSKPVTGAGSADGTGHSMRGAPPQLHYGFTWDALQRIEAAHEIQAAS